MEKTRLFVLTDISTLTAEVGEPDDTQSFIRLLLYANHFDIEGLAATYTVHGHGVPHTDYLQALVREYARVQKNLALHDPAYPTAEALLACIKAGLPRCGMEQVGEQGDSDASAAIIRAVDRPDPRPLWLLAWGGVTDLAQALWRVKTSRSRTAFARFCQKLCVYAVGDQYDAAGPWLRANCPDLLYITAATTFRGMYKGGDEDFVSPAWVAANIKAGGGPLGDAYPNYDGGDCFGPVRGVKEGDTPSLLYLLPTGLSDPEHPTWGSWGGRFAGANNRYFDVQPAPDSWATVSHWRRAYQNDFAARLAWCIKPCCAANHAPVPVVAEPPLLPVRPGERVALHAGRSHDPDGDALTYRWWVYTQPGTCAAPLRGATTDTVTLTIPANAAPGEELHVMLTLQDTGTPPLTAYHRTVLAVQG